MLQQVRVVGTAEGVTQVQQRVGTFMVDASGAFCGVQWAKWEAMPTVLVSELLPDQMIINSQGLQHSDDTHSPAASAAGPFAEGVSDADGNRVPDCGGVCVGGGVSVWG